MRKKIGLFSLTGCEGCYCSILEPTLDFVELKKKLNIKDFRLWKDEEFFNFKNLDIALVEGSPITKENIKQLKEIRKNCKILIALGSCAHIGGIYHLKNYHQKEKLLDYVYHQKKGINNPTVLPLEKIVKVDYVIPGCPVDAGEALNIIYQLIIGKKPILTEKPVCFECQTQGNPCLLQQGKLCLGPIIRGGCQAVCLKSGQECWGCRGILDNKQIDNFIKELKEKYNFSDKEIKRALEIFGVKEFI